MSIDHDSLRQCLRDAELIVCDPPWRYGRNAASNGWRSSARRFYAALTEEELCSMRVGDHCADDAILLLWTVSSKIPAAIRIMESWSFSFRCVWQTWVKVGQNGKPVLGLGKYSRSSTEFLLLGIKNKVGRLLSPHANDVSGIIFGRRTGHSKKPPEALERIERRFTPCKRVELFCRGQPAPGWVGFGDQLDEMSDSESE